ncbi:hypothetical protein NC651_006379 [Populus alba x Populus x berolinensis]|nr:hypothetical protein NC651_006379 [Populus alba x Populus x berolinensis]
MNTTKMRDFSENTSYKNGNSSNLSLTTSFLINNSPISPPSTRPASLYSSSSSLILYLFELENKRTFFYFFKIKFIIIFFYQLYYPYNKMVLQFQLSFQYYNEPFSGNVWLLFTKIQIQKWHYSSSNMTMMQRRVSFE